MASSRHLRRRLLALTTGLSTLAFALPLRAQQDAPRTFPNPLDELMREQTPSRPLPPPLMRRMPDGKMRPAPMRTNTVNTRPELAQRTQPRTEPLRDNQALGNQGIHKVQTESLPFGSKGERVAVAFGRGEWLPPAGERVQPALLALAQQRIADAAKIANGEAVRPSVYALLVVNGRMDAELKRTLAGLGVELFGFYPHTAYQARIPAAVLEQTANLPQIRWVGQPSRINKLEPELEAVVNGKAFDKHALLSKETGESLFPVYFALFAPDADGAIRDLIRDEGGKINHYSAKINVVQADVTRATLERILAMDAVLYAELVPVHTALHTRSLPSINADWFWGAYDPLPPGSTGQVRMGIIDSGVHSAHTDFGHVPVFGLSFISGESVWTDLNGHGTHVAGTMIGRGAGNSRYRGIAAGIFDTGNTNPDFTAGQVFNSGGSSVGGSVLDGLEYMNGETITNRVRQVFNYSGGGGGTGQTGTDTNSRKVDEIFQNNVLAVVAAGNSGSGAQTVLQPGVAKGALTVGSIYDNDILAGSGLIAGNTDSIAGSSSRGPTGDGRVKPDVVAPGRYIDSVATGTTNGYTFNWSGTSMAAPHVAGLAAGLIGHYNMPAWGTKAVMIASAINLGLDITAQGRGKVDGLLAHYWTDGGWSTSWSSIGATGELDYYDFNLSQAASQVRIALVWPDPPGGAGASVARVNDLDLRVQTTGALNTAWNTYNHSSSTAYDTVEFITIYNLPAGTYRIKVYGYNVSSSQPYAVCHKEIYGSPSPNLSLDMTTPYAVKPNQTFSAYGYATSGSYVASGVYGSFDPLVSGMTNQGLYYNRRSKPSTNDEWFYFDNPNPGTAGWYSPIGMNMGNIGDGRQRQLRWLVQAGAAEGTRNIRFNARSTNGGSGGVTNPVIVDGTLPTSVALRNMHWGADLKPDVVWSVRDVLSGLDVSTAWWRISTDGGATWQGWVNTTSSGSDGTTLGQTVTVNNVPFSQNNANNLIQFFILDMAGNALYTTPETITTGIPTTLSIAPTSIPTGTNATGQVTLSEAAPTDGAVVQLSSSNAAVAAVPATTTVAAGTTVSPSFTITTGAVAADTAVTISATYGGTTINKVITVKRNVSVAGKVSLESVVNSVQTMTFQFRPTDGSGNFNRVVNLNATGNYSLTNIPARQYVVWVKGAKWLANTMNVNATAGNVANANVSLAAADGNNDNVGDISDLLLVIASFNTASGGSGYNAAVDLNCDDKVDISDLLLLVSHYNQAGAP